MVELLLAAVLFVGTHLGISSTRLRPLLVRKLGRGYLPLYSLIAIAAFLWQIFAYNDIRPGPLLWGPNEALRWVSLVLMPVAFVFLIGSFLVRNPTMVGLENSVGGEPRGLLRVTRHPLQWSILLWAATHTVANGDAASLVFFGSLGALSLIGAAAIDRKRAAQLGDAWQAFASATSNVPFAAIVAGRNRLAWPELWLPILAGVIAYALALWGHRWLSGVPLL